jgi:nucleolar MIF4G domain-containing protein 1
MNESLTDLLFETLVAEVITPERLIMEHAMLVAILHANVGTEVGWYLNAATTHSYFKYLYLTSHAGDGHCQINLSCNMIK